MGPMSLWYVNTATFIAIFFFLCPILGTGTQESPDKWEDETYTVRKAHKMGRVAYDKNGQ